jgi:serine phosphatase RsbU (regulator of sigma subunit)/tetratricopeptide (TPR) repeat protein
MISKRLNSKQLIPKVSLFRTFYIILIALIFPFESYSSVVADSLHKKLNSNQKEDTSRVKILLELADHFFDLADDSCLYYLDKVEDLSNKIDFKKGVAQTYTLKGEFYNAKGDYQLALKNFHKSYNYSEEMKDRRGMCNLMNSMGNTHIGMLDYKKALESYKSSYSIAVKDSINYMIGIASIGIGNVYIEQKKSESALEYFEKAKDVFKEENAIYPLSISYSLIGSTLFELGKTDEGFVYFDKALENLKAIDNQYGIAGTYELISSSYEKIGNYLKAVEYAKKAYKIFKEREAYDNVQKISLSIASIYKRIGRIDNAYTYLEFHTRYKDSVYSIDKNRQILNLEAKFENEKKSKKIALMERENEFSAVEKKNQRVVIFLISLGAVSVIIFLLFVLNRMRIIKRQKKLIEQQKEEVDNQKDIVDKKNTEILDSIFYAKRLQDAILPGNKLVNSYLMESLIIYKPKDIVAGDFYFMDVIEEENKKLIYYVVADCTGHGVPGAMVSIVGANGLKRCIQEFGLRDPGEILDKLSELVADNFSQSEERIRDGMDLALCCLESIDDKILRVHYAGANNPLWIFNPSRTSWPENMTPFEFGGGAEIKANRQAIGYTENVNPFKTHTVELEKNDSLYTFSDGFVDQFGSDINIRKSLNGKKYKSVNFRKLILSIQDKNMAEQKQLLTQTFEEWKGNFDQVDDVCIIGVRI